MKFHELWDSLCDSLFDRYLYVLIFLILRLWKMVRKSFFLDNAYSKQFLLEKWSCVVHFDSKHEGTFFQAIREVAINIKNPNLFDGLTRVCLARKLAERRHPSVLHINFLVFEIFEIGQSIACRLIHPYPLILGSLVRELRWVIIHSHFNAFDVESGIWSDCL